MSGKNFGFLPYMDIERVVCDHIYIFAYHHRRRRRRHHHHHHHHHHLMIL
jgi:hypothetical protein